MPVVGREKKRFRPRLHTRIHSIRINDVQSQLNNQSLMILSIYEACIDAEITFNFSKHQIAHIEKARQFREVEKESARIKEKEQGDSDDTIF